MSRDYSDYWSRLKASHASHPGNRFRYELIAGELARRHVRPERVIDCGCGDGALLAVVSARIPCGELNGFDIADGTPASRPGTPIHFQQHDLGQPVPVSMHGRFALVLRSEVIEHVENDDVVLNNPLSIDPFWGTGRPDHSNGRYLWNRAVSRAPSPL